MTVEQQDEQTDTPVSTGAGIAIAAIWLSWCALLCFVAWLLVTKVDVVGSDVDNEQSSYAMLAMGYIVLTAVTSLVAYYATCAVRVGKH